MKRFEGVNEKLKNKEARANRMMALINPAMNMLLYLGMVGVIVVGAWRVNLGLSRTGRILAFMSYFQMISRSLMAVSRMFIMYSRGMASSARVMEIINSETEKDYVPGNYPDGDPQYAIEFRDVTFSYLKVKDNLKHISFKLRKGETLGIIGATGAGKSTVLSLLLHFYAVDQGAIYLNGRDIRNFTPQELRKQFGIVMQNDFLFRDSVAENIRFGREVSDEEMLEAEEDAQAAEFISGLQERNDYMLTTKGTNLSGGQRQRVLLSRAFAGRPEFLLLDDSSSALDYQTDASLRRALNEKYPDTTMIIIAQRVSSIKNCDEIIVLDHGAIDGRGSHEELSRDNQLYQMIADSQMGGALFD
jgi:ATP-binding cassette subfamily B protein